MPINFQCVCGKPFWTADANAGRRMLCTGCGREIGVPQPREEGIVFIETTHSLWWKIGRSLRFLTSSTLVNWGVGLTILAVLAALMLPPVRSGAREGARRSQCINNLKQIGLGFHNFHSEFGHFPTAITDAKGKPLLSWRVRILPYIEHHDLYRQFNLDEPWDSPHNWPLIAKMPNIFTCPSNKRRNDGKSEYQIIVGPGSLYDGDKPPSIGDVTDGTSWTLCVVETNNMVVWTKPDDVDIRSIGTDLGSEHSGGYNVLFADGSVKFFKNGMDPTILQAFATKAGGEHLDPDTY